MHLANQSDVALNSIVSFCIHCISMVILERKNLCCENTDIMFEFSVLHMLHYAFNNCIHC